MRNKLLKGALVVVGAVVVSTVGIFAADTLQGIDRSLIGLSGSAIDEGCGTGMVLVKNGDASFCSDIYEASPSNNCPYQEPGSTVQSLENSSSRECNVLSEPERKPWRFISLTQAQTMCAAAGKRLPTSKEWYALALGTRSGGCVLESSTGQPSNTGSVECISASNVYDSVGNVWEWVNETVTNGRFNNRVLPETGYVTSVDADGVAIKTNNREEILYGTDYFWSKNEGTYGMIRGGYYGSKSDGGLYATNASVETSFSSPGVGFRCVKDL